METKNENKVVTMNAKIVSYAISTKYYDLEGKNQLWLIIKLGSDELYFNFYDCEVSGNFKSTIIEKLIKEFSEVLNTKEYKNFLRVRYNQETKKIEAFGNLIEEKWLDIQEFIESKEKELNELYKQVLNEIKSGNNSKTSDSKENKNLYEVILYKE